MQIIMSHVARYLSISVLALFLFSDTPGSAQSRTFDLDPAQTTVAFTLGDVLHTVHGTFHLKPGKIQFDDTTGEASGELVRRAQRRERQCQP
jgi:polyisoprenoid-binding protein YceI